MAKLSDDGDSQGRGCSTNNKLTCVAIAFLVQKCLLVRCRDDNCGANKLLPLRGTEINNIKDKQEQLDKQSWREIFWGKIRGGKFPVALRLVPDMVCEALLISLLPRRAFGKWNREIFLLSFLAGGEDSSVKCLSVGACGVGEHNKLWFYWHSCFMCLGVFTLSEHKLCGRRLKAKAEKNHDKEKWVFVVRPPSPSPLLLSIFSSFPSFRCSLCKERWK